MAIFLCSSPSDNLNNYQIGSPQKFQNLVILYFCHILFYESKILNCGPFNWKKNRSGPLTWQELGDTVLMVDSKTMLYIYTFFFLRTGISPRLSLKCKIAATSHGRCGKDL